MTVRVRVVIGLAILLRALLIVYGAYQDAHSALKYTDVDYRVFSDAAHALLHPKPGEYAQGWLATRFGWSIGELSTLTTVPAIISDLFMQSV